MHSWYWSETFVNEHGESLRTCLERYGTGGDEDDVLTTRLVYLDATRSDCNSWLLNVRERSSGALLLDEAHELDPDTFRCAGPPPCHDLREAARNRVRHELFGESHAESHALSHALPHAEPHDESHTEPL